MARIDLIRDAHRPRMNGRALFKGPQGSGKTWTALSVARNLTAENGGKTLVIDTERESALTYADVFSFQHLPWRPPYDPAELTRELALLSEHYGENDVLLIDSISHFWQGTGGTLDIANGRVQGGWDKARPIQNAWVEQLLAMPCHLLLCARMKSTVLVSDNGKTIENIGLTIVQSDDLEYELNIVAQLDLGHSVTITKSRTTAVPVGRVYPAGYESKLATEYAEWLAGGIPPANRADVDRIVALFAGIADREHRAKLKAEFVGAFGMPHALVAERVPDALAWLSDHGCAVDLGPAADAQQETAPEPSPKPAEAKPAPTPPKPGRVAQTKPEAVHVPARGLDGQAQCEAVAAMSRAEVIAELVIRDADATGTEIEQRDRLIDELLVEAEAAQELAQLEGAAQ